MVTEFKLINNVGKFSIYSTTNDTKLKKLTLVYSENGRGKTTISSILRSLSNGNPNAILGKRRLGVTQLPKVVINLNETNYVFENGQWNSINENIKVFDDYFVDENVYSGLTVTPNHRQNLHEVILGNEGVMLARRVDKITTQIADLTRDLSSAVANIPLDIRFGMQIDDFCNLQNVENIDQLITQKERNLTASRQNADVRSHALFPTISLPEIDIAQLADLLKMGLENLETLALERVKQQFIKLGQRSENWVSIGLGYLDAQQDNNCPFCDQRLDGVILVDNYRSYFSDEYKNLKTAIDELAANITRVFHGDELARIERTIQTLDQYRGFWSQFIEVENIVVDDTLATKWSTARECVISLLQRKQNSPLDVIEISDRELESIQLFSEVRSQILANNTLLNAINLRIQELRYSIGTINVQTLTNDLSKHRAIKSRFTEEVNRLCEEYIALNSAKNQLEEAKTETKRELNTFRQNTFPRYQERINHYLSQFNAGFQITSVKPLDAAGRPSSNYKITINGNEIELTGNDSTPSFKNSLSAGDRNAVALAFFFSAINTTPEVLSNNIFVIDDPMSSLDEHRQSTTVEEIVQLAQGAKQVIVLSHSKDFLFRIFDRSRVTDKTGLCISRNENLSTITAWDVKNVPFLENDKQRRLLREFIDGEHNNARDVALSLRDILNYFLRACYPDIYGPESSIGDFLGRCRLAIQNGTPVITQEDYDELDFLTNYAHSFHHPDGGRGQINETELIENGKRIITFTRRGV